MALAGGGQVKDEAAERFGEYDGFPAEPQVYFAVAGLDVTEGKAADGGGLLGVEQDEQPGDPVLGLEGGVVQQLPGLCPASLGVDEAGVEAYRFRRQLYYATCAILVSIPSSYSEGVRYPSPF